MSSQLTTDFVVSAFIVFDHKVLLCHHKKHEKWLPIGGHLEENEDPEIALFREVKEECGLPIELKATKNKLATSLYLPDHIDRHQAGENHDHVAFIYFARTNTPDFSLQATEHNALRWFTAEELEDKQYDLWKPTIFYAQESLKAWSN